MGKVEQIRYWIETSEDDWPSVQLLLKNGRYPHSLFFAHLVIEKLLKAHWVKDHTANFPPKIHNLMYLAEDTNLKLPDEFIDELRIINSWNIEGGTRHMNM